MAIFSNNSEPDQKLSQTALILEHVEMLLALQEEQGKQAPDGLSQLLSEKTSEISNSLESQIGTRFAELESQVEKLSELINQQNLTFESLDPPIESSAATEPAFIEQRIQFEESMNRITEQFGQQTNLIAESFNSKIEQLFADLGSRVTQISDGIKQQTSPAAEPLMPGTPNHVEPLLDTSTDSTTHWHQQKEAMLSKYGLDTDYRPVSELEKSVDGQAKPEDDNEAAEIAAEPMSEIDAGEIKRIKDQLNEKLREAEVELSINRAKLSQQQAEMESAQVELDRRAAAIEEKYAAVRKAPKRRIGFLERLSRHLGQKQVD